MTIRNLAENDDIVVAPCFLNNVVGNICFNTEEAIKSDVNSVLFVCIRGPKYDTHNDIEKIISKGIKNIIIERDVNIDVTADDLNIIRSFDTRKTLAIASRLYFDCPDKELKIIGITGTKGKTTVSYMIKDVLENAGIKCGLMGTNGIFYDGNKYDCVNSTPGTYEYYFHLRKMADCRVSYVVCEITSQSLKQYRTYGTVFDIAVFTNLYPDHIGEDEHKDFYEYRLCKSLIFDKCRKAVLNMDDDNFKYFASVCLEKNIPYISFSKLSRFADYRCRHIRLKCSCSSFFFLNKKITVRLPGEFNLINALCASVVLNELGINSDKIVTGIENINVPGRCESVENPFGINIIIDYAHNKESLENILRALKKRCKRKLYCVFGAGGDRSNLRRIGMGEVAAMYADFSVITSDNPRSENPEKIISDILKGFPEKFNRYIVIPDREQAIYYALSRAKKGDTILLAGKGNQNYQEISGVRYPFNEREVVSRYYNESVIQQ